MKKSRAAALLGAATACLIALAGCSSSPTTQSSAPVKTLTAWDYYTYNPVQGSVTSLLNACGKAVGVTIKHQSIPYAQYSTKILQAASSKSLPGILMLDNPDIPRFATTGALADLSKLGVSTAGYVPSVATLGVYDKTLYGVVPGVNTLALYYNKADFTKAGLTPPTTWAELKADALKLKSGSRYGLAVSSLGDGEGSYTYYPFYLSAGGSVASQSALSSAAGTKSLEYYSSLVSSGAVSKASLNWGLNDVQNQFIGKTASMVITGPWATSSFTAAKIDWGTVPIPVPAAGDASKQVLGGEAWTVPVASTATETAAAKVVSCLTNEKNQLTFGSTNGRLPSNATALAADLKLHPEMAAFQAAVPNSIARAGALGEKWPAFDTAASTAIQSAVAGKSTAQAALAIAAKG